MPIQGFLDGFQTQLTADMLNTDTVASFPTAAMVPGLQYHIRIDDSNPITTFEYLVVQYQDANTVTVVNGAAGRGVGGTGAGTHIHGANSGFVTAVLLRESLLPTFARLDTENLMAFASSSMISGQVFNAYGAPGAVTPSRYVGATSGAAPTTGAFLQGDFVLDTANNIIWICTVAGSPGTWQNILNGNNTGLGGAVSSLTRMVGATAGGPPQSSTWTKGDVVSDRKGTLWICVTGGAPGIWTPVGVYKFDLQVSTAAVGSVTLNIPTGAVFGSIDLEVECRSDQAGTQGLLAQFNGDVAGNYYYTFFQATSTSAPGGSGPLAAQTSARMGGVNLTGAPAGSFDYNRIRISNADGVNGMRKYYDYHMFQATTDVATSFTQELGAGYWANVVAAISSIKLFPTAGSFSYVRARGYAFPATTAV